MPARATLHQKRLIQLHLQAVRPCSRQHLLRHPLRLRPQRVVYSTISAPRTARAVVVLRRATAPSAVRLMCTTRLSTTSRHSSPVLHQRLLCRLPAPRLRPSRLLSLRRTLPVYGIIPAVKAAPAVPAVLLPAASVVRSWCIIRLTTTRLWVDFFSKNQPVKKRLPRSG